MRTGSGSEAEQTADWARSLGFEAQLLCWNGPKPKTGIEEKARAVRYRLMGQWCADNGVPALFVAHTRDDQAETFLLRLGRGSGVDGLSSMRWRGPLPLPGFGSVELLRPLLDFGRAELRGYARAAGASWLEDPMNEDLQFARVRIRKALPILEAAGLSIERIAEAARHLARARDALEHATDAFLNEHARFSKDGALLDGAALLKLPRETGLRALSAALMRVGGTAYRPRFERLEALFDSIKKSEFRGRTLLDCRVGRAAKARAAFGPSTLFISREGPRRSSFAKIEE